MLSKQPSSTILTLTLPDPGEEGTLLIQRGDLAHLCQFTYMPETDFTTVIQRALVTLVDVENNPPVISDPPPRKTTVTAVPTPPAEPPEQMIQVPTKTKKGTTAVPARCLRIVGGETDEVAQQQALKIAGRLLDSGLWDGKTPIGINDVYAVQLSLDGLTDKELKVLFTLEQFVQVNPVVAKDEISTSQDKLAEDKDAQNTPEDSSDSGA